MNILTFLLQAEAIVENVAAQAADSMTPEAVEQTGKVAANGQASPWTTWIMLLGVFVVMWLFMIRPQRKAQKEQEQFIKALERGNKVVTIGGIYGTIVEVTDNNVLLEVDNGVKIRVLKSSIQKA